MDASNQIPQDDSHPSDAIVIIPQRFDIAEPSFSLAWKNGLVNSDAIVINPMDNLPGPSQKPSSEQSVLPQETLVAPREDGASMPDAPAACSSLAGSQQPLSTEVHFAQVTALGDVANAISQTGLVEDMDPLISPQIIDQDIQEQGKELHELLSLFKQANSEPLSAFVLQTPQQKLMQIAAHPSLENVDASVLRSSPRLEKKYGKGKNIA
jgi:hypothetical protein